MAVKTSSLDDFAELLENKSKTPPNLASVNFSIAVLKLETVLLVVVIEDLVDYISAN